MPITLFGRTLFSRFLFVHYENGLIFYNEWANGTQNDEVQM
jgi:hypothetical protein